MYLEKKSKKIIIGRVEKIDLPTLSIFNLDSKIDTGAYTSSLHCHHISVDMRDSKKWVCFHVLDPSHPEYEDRKYECPVHDIRKVKSSNGLVEERIIIKQQAIFFGIKRMIELSLTNRSEMKFPILLGRKFLSNKFIVDVSKKYLYEKV